LKQQKAAANAKYIKKAYELITVRVHKGEKQKYSEFAEKKGVSLNKFIIDAMNKQMEEK
jgi:predicted HicB family RNase H-like nuclease